MKITFVKYRFLSAIAGETLILISRFLNLFIKNEITSFFFKRSFQNIISSRHGRKKIWFYASSVGEAGVCEILIKEILKQKKNIDFHVSLMTDSGCKIAHSNLSHLADISYSPIDTPFNVEKTFKIIKPDLLCIIETELWPNLIFEAKKNKIPVIISNARISNSSLKNYLKIKELSEFVLSLVDRFYAASFKDRKNLLQLSCANEKIFVTGNAKYDFYIDKNNTEKIRKTFQKMLGFNENDLIFVCGSTREGEEEILTSVFKKLKNNFPDLKLVLVPRHLSRLDEIKKIFIKKNIDFRLRTENSDKKSDAVIIDTMGELKKIYTLADIVFVGGSLKNFGGQNILEPASLGKPVIFGRYMDDFKEISQIILSEKGGFQVSEADIYDVIRNLLEDNDLRKTTGLNAFYAVEKNRGAAKKQAEEILKALG
jgi:3-deoxy-D-manno-octulosonic-acid transferase